MDLLSGLFSSCFPTKTLYIRLPSPMRATFTAHFILLYLITRIIFGDEYISLSSSSCRFQQSPLTLSLLGPNILLSTLFSYTIRLRFSLNMSVQVSQPYKTTGKIIVLLILFTDVNAYWQNTLHWVMQFTIDASNQLYLWACYITWLHYVSCV